VQNIYLDAKDVPPQLRGTYTGKKFSVVVTESMTIPADAGLWDGGSRSTYSAVRLADGTAMSFPGQNLAPWDARADRKIDLQPGFVVKRHSIFCGKDSGLTFYLHPQDAAPMLPTKAELTDHESLVLNATIGFKSSYAGKDRYQMMAERINPIWAPRDERKPFPTREQWDAAKQSLIARGLLNKAGAVTPAGRNANPRGF
jgi:hypothetical protein